MSTFFTVIHIISCIFLVLVVLVQSGKEGGIGVAGGGGSSQTIFGSSGGANFFTKFTAAIAAVFMMTALLLSVLKGGQRSSIFSNSPATIPVEQPVQTEPKSVTEPAPGTVQKTTPAEVSGKKSQ